LDLRASWRSGKTSVVPFFVNPPKRKKGSVAKLRTTFCHIQHIATLILGKLTMEYDPKILRQNPRAPHTSRWVRRRGSAGIVGGCIPSDVQDLGTGETSRAVLGLAIAGLSRLCLRLERALVLCADLADETRERGCRSPRDTSDRAAPPCARRCLTTLLTVSASRLRTEQTVVKEKQ